MPTIKVGDIDIYYEIHGKGEPLVMIFGAGMTVESYAQMIPVFSTDYRLVIFDNRGVGRSSKPSFPYTTEMMADDLAGLLDAIGIDAAHFQGASMGGMIAQQFALKYPKRVKSLILVCTYCGGPHAIPLPEEVFRLQDKSREEFVAGVIRLGVTKEFIEKHPVEIEQIRQGMSKQLHLSPGQTSAVQNHNAYDRLSEIRVPALIIHGDADQIIPVGNARILANRIPNSEVAILKNTGHLGVEAGPEAARLQLDFLKRHSSPVR